MTPVVVERLGLRGILDSRGSRTVEAEMDLAGGGRGRGSAPVAIAPGRRESRRSYIARLGQIERTPEVDELVHAVERRRFPDQEAFDALLAGLPAARALGADVRMAVSLAFCRARVDADGGSIVDELASIAGTKPAMPRLLVNVFSGGIHDLSGSLPFQQVMFAPGFGSLGDDVSAALAVYGDVERRMSQHGPVAYSASSGMVAPALGAEHLLNVLVDAVSRCAPGGSDATIGIDVAAEHLVDADGLYHVEGEPRDGEALLESHRAMLRRYPIAFFEDPFAPDDVGLWRALRDERRETTQIFGDDIFVTSEARVDNTLADGLVVKVNQVGSLHGALSAARRAIDLGMSLCVSHRSGETGDTFLCDLAVALGAAFIKLGGPRRGDRTEKYNQLLRLAEVWE